MAAWAPSLPPADAGALLSLALAPSPARAAALVRALPDARARALARALGLAAAPARRARAELEGAAAWAAKYRALRAAHAPRSAAAFAAALPRAREALGAAAHLVQAEAGSAVLVGPDAVLTCAHCVCAEGDPEDDDEEAGGAGGGGAAAAAPPPPPARVGRAKLVLLAGGGVLVAECVAADERADLALLRVVARAGPAAPWVAPRAAPPRARERVACVGNPSEFDLERGAGRRIAFAPPVFHVSEGECRGETDPARRAALRGLGGLRHTAWTYWGHSGAPLLDAEGRLAGLHNSWDSDNGARHGVHWRDIAAFLAPFALPPPPPLAGGEGGAGAGAVEGGAGGGGGSEGRDEGRGEGGSEGGGEGDYASGDDDGGGGPAWMRQSPTAARAARAARAAARTRAS